MAKGLWVKKDKAPTPENINWDYFGEGYEKVADDKKALCYIVTKSDNTQSFFVRINKSLIDPSLGEKITGKFIPVDQDIYKLYKAYLEAGHYAGYTEANKQIRARGFA